VVVELSGHERADDEVPRLERLVGGRRLVDPTGDRLEVADVEPERPEVTVPADEIGRVMAVVVGGHAIRRADMDDVVTLVGTGFDELGRVEVAL
jgi:hypothetical protein